MCKTMNKMIEIRNFIFIQYVLAFARSSAYVYVNYHGKINLCLYYPRQSNRGVFAFIYVRIIQVSSFNNR